MKVNTCLLCISLFILLIPAIHSQVEINSQRYFDSSYFEITSPSAQSSRSLVFKEKTRHSFESSSNFPDYSLHKTKEKSRAKKGFIVGSIIGGSLFIVGSIVYFQPFPWEETHFILGGAAIVGLIYGGIGALIGYSIDRDKKTS